MTFTNASQLEQLIDAYFKHIEGEFHFEDIPVKSKTDDDVTEKKKVWDRPPEQPTISGLALYLGFDSCDALDDYCANGQYAPLIKRARLRIETAYEQKLHQGPASGAIFALKKLGWNQHGANTHTDSSICELNVNVNNNGPPVADNEKDVMI